MRSAGHRVLVSVLVSTVLVRCSNPAESLHSDVDAARHAWVTAAVTAYTFEVATASSWFPMSGYYQVRVSDRQVLSATGPGGEPVESFTLTIDVIWDQLLAARDRGELNSVVFNERGVPIETDFGPWPVDGGVHYSVRNFAAGYEFYAPLALRDEDQAALRARFESAP